MVEKRKHEKFTLPAHLTYRLKDSTERIIGAATIFGPPMQSIQMGPIVPITYTTTF